MPSSGQNTGKFFLGVPLSHCREEIMIGCLHLAIPRAQTWAKACWGRMLATWGLIVSEIGTLGPTASIRLRSKNSSYASEARLVQK